MLFPDGVLPSGRWRWALGAVVAVGTVWMIGAFAIAAETIALGHVVVESTGDLKQIDDPTSGWVWWGDPAVRLVRLDSRCRPRLARESCLPTERRPVSGASS